MMEQFMIVSVAVRAYHLLHKLLLRLLVSVVALLVASLLLSTLRNQVNDKKASGRFFVSSESLSSEDSF
jgi:hypothetical protein